MSEAIFDVLAPRMKPYIIVAMLLSITACTSKKEHGSSHLESIEQQLRQLTQQINEAEVKDDLPTFLQHYDQHVISMPEYQRTLDGHSEIEMFYREIFKRQDVKSFHRYVQEFIHLQKTIVEIGTFKKEYTDLKTDSLVTLNGKYWYVWHTQPDGSFKLKGEAFGYFHPVAHPDALIMSTGKSQPDDSTIYSQKEIPFELKAYNALMEKGVRTRDGILRSSFFTNDASLFPFADTTVKGMEKIRPYLIAYSNRGVITIDSIMCYTYDFEYANEYILEYDMFKVKWSVPNFSGRTEGKGIRIWKRQSDQSLRLYREIGTHNHIE